MKDENLQKRGEYWQEIRDVAPENLVFLDEMAVLLGMMRLMARSKKGERIYDLKPFYRGARVTAVGAISIKAILALKTVGESMKGPDFYQIEHLWWQLKAFIRRFAPKNKEAVTKLLELGVKLCSSEQLTHYFTHCCYCT